MNHFSSWFGMLIFFISIDMLIFFISNFIKIMANTFWGRKWRNICKLKIWGNFLKLCFWGRFRWGHHSICIMEHRETCVVGWEVSLVSEKSGFTDSDILWVVLFCSCSLEWIYYIHLLVDIWAVDSFVVVVIWNEAAMFWTFVRKSLGHMLNI